MMKRVLSILAIVALLALTPPTSRADGDSSREYQLKAAFIFNFLPFIEWPADAFEGEKSPLIIGVVGADPFRGSLDMILKDKTVAGRPVVLKHFSDLGSVEKCQLLFVSSGEAGRMSEAHKKLDAMHILTVGDSDNFTRLKGAVRFYKEDNKIRFEVNTAALERAKLKVSAKLLKLAKVVEE
jgi:hypothetical protein